MELILKSLQSLKNLSINFVFSPVPDLTKSGLDKVKNLIEAINSKEDEIKTLKESDFSEKTANFKKTHTPEG